MQTKLCKLHILHDGSTTAVQKPSAMDKARAKTAVLTAGVQEDLNRLREKLTVNDVRLFHKHISVLISLGIGMFHQQRARL